MAFNRFVTLLAIDRQINHELLHECSLVPHALLQERARGLGPAHSYSMPTADRCFPSSLVSSMLQDLNPSASCDRPQDFGLSSAFLVSKPFSQVLLQLIDPNAPSLPSHCVLVYL